MKKSIISSFQYRFLAKRARDAAKMANGDCGKAMRAAIRVHFSDLLLAQVTISGNGKRPSAKTISLSEIGLLTIYIRICEEINPKFNFSFKLQEFVFGAQSRMNSVEVSFQRPCDDF